MSRLKESEIEKPKTIGGSGEFWGWRIRLRGWLLEEVWTTSTV